MNKTSDYENNHDSVGMYGCASIPFVVVVRVTVFVLLCVCV